jgi:hypothetical protein
LIPRAGRPGQGAAPPQQLYTILMG